MVSHNVPGPIGRQIATFSARARFTDQFMALQNPLGLSAPPADTTNRLLDASASAPEVAVEVDGPAPPSPIALPPFTNAGPSVHPALPPTCQAGLFFGAPPTQRTKGTRLSPTEVARRRADITAAIGRAKATRPLSAANLQHWLDNSGSLLKMPATPFLNGDSGVPGFLNNEVRNRLERGITQRLKNTKHQQGTLAPASSAVGAVGPIRFLQVRDGTRPSITKPGIGADLATALGAFFVHSAVWVRAKITSKSGGFLTIGQDVTFEVEILRWCVQIYDTYDWNIDSTTPIPVPENEVSNLPIPREAASISRPFAGFVVVKMKDQYFRDLEVSGGGKSYLIFTDPFAAPTSVTAPFSVTI